MQMYVSRNNQQLGPFEEAKVLEMLGNGGLLRTDLAIRQGEQQWQPLAGMYQGVAVPNPATQAAQSASKTRTTIRLSSNHLQAVESWATANDFRQKSAAENEKTYQRGYGLLVGPTMLRIKSENHELVLEVWIRMNLFVRLLSLFILPAEMGIESGGIKSVLPRTLARNLFNQLLTQLGQPLIG